MSQGYVRLVEGISAIVSEWTHSSAWRGRVDWGHDSPL